MLLPLFCFVIVGLLLTLQPGVSTDLAVAPSSSLVSACDSDDVHSPSCKDLHMSLLQAQPPLMTSLSISREPYVLPGGIPKILHQQWGDKPLPEDLAAYRNSWISCLDDEWDVKLWTDAENRELVRKYLPTFLPVYDGYNEDIKRYDAIRYIFMYYIGGVYADLDLECLRSPEPLLAQAPAALAYAVPWCYMEAALMASRPGHPFFKYALEQLPSRAQFNVRVATGCNFLTLSFEEYTGALKYRTKIGPRVFHAMNDTSDPNAMVVLGTDDVIWDYCPGPEEQRRLDYPNASLVNHYAGVWVTDAQKKLEKHEPGTPAYLKEKGEGCEDMMSWADECNLTKELRFSGELIKGSV